jgi:hypothetical protein
MTHLGRYNSYNYYANGETLNLNIYLFMAIPWEAVNRRNQIFFYVLNFNTSFY